MSGPWFMFLAAFISTSNRIRGERENKEKKSMDWGMPVAQELICEHGTLRFLDLQHTYSFCQIQPLVILSRQLLVALKAAFSKYKKDLIYADLGLHIQFLWLHAEIN